MKDNWLVLELSLKPKTEKWPTVFGPFNSEEEANEFCNARIQMLAGEWCQLEGILTDCLKWHVKRACNPL